MEKIGVPIGTSLDVGQILHDFRESLSGISARRRERYRELGRQYLDDEYYEPLAEGRNVLAGRHAHSYVNSLSSAMQVYLTLGSEKHLRAAQNAFGMLSKQSFANGGWGAG